MKNIYNYNQLNFDGIFLAQNFWDYLKNIQI